MSTEAALPQIFLQPGELHFATKPTSIETILGSCVGISFWSPRHAVGALCHAMLPTQPAVTNNKDGLRYVDFCIHELARRFDALGVPRAEVEVKLFGGADMFSSTTPQRPGVGHLNATAALDLLRSEGFTITASSLGKSFGRKIKFNTATGEVLLLRLTHYPSEKAA